jgi:hypothetical protein
LTPDPKPNAFDKLQFVVQLTQRSTPVVIVTSTLKFSNLIDKLKFIEHFIDQSDWQSNHVKIVAFDRFNEQ